MNPPFFFSVPPFSVSAGKGDPDRPLDVPEAGLGCGGGGANDFVLLLLGGFRLPKPFFRFL